MKYFIAVLCLAALAAAAPQQPKEEIAILRQDNVHGTDRYEYKYDTANGISVSEQGQLKTVKSDEGPAIVAQGEYSYTDNEGNRFTVKYVADENGFQPQGAHLPVAPPVPEAIQKAIEYIRAQQQ